MSNEYFARTVSKPDSPFKNRALTCQLNAPGNTVKLATETAKPACSKVDTLVNPLINRKSETPACLSIKDPNHIKVNALLQQQKSIRSIDSSKKPKPRPVTAYPSWLAVLQASSFFPSS